MRSITVILVDDEFSSREELKRALTKYKDFNVIGEVENADNAKKLIELQKPDLIFLDIQMPEKTGFDLLESLSYTPYVIFTTAYNEYAVQAFEVNALHYLMKPIRDERFEEAIERIRSAIEPTERKIFLKDGEKRFFVQLNDIYLIESLEHYTRLFFKDKKAIQRRSIRQWEKILNSNDFFRINRKEIINIRFVQEVYKNQGGTLKLKLNTGQLLEVSKRQSIKFKDLNGI